MHVAPLRLTVHVTPCTLMFYGSLGKLVQLLLTPAPAEKYRGVHGMAFTTPEFRKWMKG